MAKVFNGQWLKFVTQLYTPECGSQTLTISNRVGLAVDKDSNHAFIMDAPGETFIINYKGVIYLPDPDRKNNTGPMDLSILNGNFVLMGNNDNDVDGCLRMGTGDGLILTMQRDSTFSIEGSSNVLIAHDSVGYNHYFESNLYDNSTLSVNLNNNRDIHGICIIGGTYNLTDEASFFIYYPSSVKGHSFQRAYFKRTKINLESRSRLEINADIILAQNLNGSSGLIINIHDNASVKLQSQSGEKDPLQILTSDEYYQGLLNFSETSQGKVSVDVPDGRQNSTGLALIMLKKIIAINNTPVLSKDFINYFDISYDTATRDGKSVGVITFLKK
ncbi:hypothetical protein [Raoultella ornithinolytica]|uniref:hypothetical protein n=1 Tax=Raoultella ornithinolytica TaxID=54291 RepID=UPI0021AF8D7E|nr:hypothetical protein [Raoultella ornithinolytica]MCT4737202.1 hypothetical protein [Raoultella ornithinolytica]